MTAPSYKIRNAEPHEYGEIGKLLVDVYAQLDGFPKPSELPGYYKMLAQVGELANKPQTEILVATTHDNKIMGAVVYFNDMIHYGSGGTATQEQNAAGFRLLAVNPSARGHGIGKQLTMVCIQKAQGGGKHQLIIHTTKAMQTAWAMYESVGFKRAEDLDFIQGQLPVYGFKMIFTN